MNSINELLPFLIPLILLQLTLFGITLWHIVTHEHYKHGNRILWLAVTIIGMNLIGPILYFLFGKEEV